MATSAIGSGDLAKLRGGQSISAVDVYTVKKEQVATATITAVPDVVPYNSVTVGSTSNWSDVEEGMLVRIYNGSDTRCYATVSGPGNATTLEISTTFTGAPGYPQNIRAAIQVSDSVEVIRHFPLWGLYSTIQNDTFYKNWDDSYTDQNISPPPCANTGPWQAAKIAVGGSATFTLPPSGSNTSYEIAGANITTYLWEVPTGVTITTGTSADSEIGVTATYGQHLVKLTVTDENAKTAEAYVWLFVDDGTNYTAVGTDHIITDLSLARSRRGVEGSLSLVGDNVDLLPSAPLLIKETAEFDGGALTSGVLIDTTMVYVTDMELSHNGQYGGMTLQFASPSIYADRVAQLTQYVEAYTTTPAKWSEAAFELIGPEFALFYAMRWHAPNIMRMHDFDPDNSDYATPRPKYVKYESDSLGEAMQFAGKKIAGNVGCSSDSAIKLRKNVLYRDSSTRNSNAVLITLTEEDAIAGEIRWQKRVTAQAREVRIGGFYFNGNSNIAYRGMYRWEQGVSYQEFQDVWLNEAEGLAEVKSICGHYMAQTNAEYPELLFPLKNNIDVIDPANMLWVRYDYDGAYDPTGQGFDSTRCIPKRVDIEYDFNEGSIDKKLTLVLEPEYFGQPGEEWVPSAVDIVSPPDVRPYDPGDDILPRAMHAINTAGWWVSTLQANRTNVEWQGRNGSSGLAGAVSDICVDYNSNYFTFGGDDNNQLGIYVVTQQSTTVRLYYVYDIYSTDYSSGNFELIHTMTAADSTGTTNARVECSYFNPDYVAVAFKDNTGVKVARSDDGGGTFGTTTLVGTTIADSTANENALFGMAWDFDVLYIAGHDGSTGYGVYKATGTGSFSAVTSTPRYSAPPASIVVDGGGNLVVSFQVLNESTITVPFGGAGYTDYGTSSSVAQITTSEPTTGGNPSDHLRALVTADYSSPTRQSGAISINNLTSGGYVRWVRIDAKWATVGGTRNVILAGLTGGNQTVADETGAAPASWTSYKKTIRDTLSGTSATVSIAPGILQDDAGYMDNIKLRMSDETGAIYLCEDPQGLGAGPTWTDISPFEGAYTTYPHAISVDPFNELIIDVMVITDDDDDAETADWYTTDDGGSTWTLVEAGTTYRYVRRNNEFIVLAGEGSLVTTTDDASTTQNRIGNMSSVITIGTLKRIVYPFV